MAKAADEGDAWVDGVREDERRTRSRQMPRWMRRSDEGVERRESRPVAMVVMVVMAVMGCRLLETGVGVATSSHCLPLGGGHGEAENLAPALWSLGVPPATVQLPRAPKVPASPTACQDWRATRPRLCLRQQLAAPGRRTGQALWRPRRPRPARSSLAAERKCGDGTAGTDYYFPPPRSLLASSHRRRRRPCRQRASRLPASALHAAAS